MLFKDDYKQKGLRNKLVSTLQKKGIKNEAVLHAINTIPRHFFLDNVFTEHAYQDKAFPIGDGQTISHPYTVAFQTDLLSISKKDRVLEIGTGSGYQACVLAELGVTLFSIEQSFYHYEKAKAYFKYFNYTNIFSFHGDGSKGLPSKAPFDKILVTAAAPVIPDDLINQLKIGGILIIPVGDMEKQAMIRITKTAEKKIKKETFGNFQFVPLVGDNGWQKKTTNI
ncbi:MAG: protein-L-isoaspartate(D-aspartate) O-methyltransferase [Cyclobacteriaceae bacterium]